MYSNQLYQFISAGKEIEGKIKAYREQSMAPLIIAVTMGIHLGTILKGYWLCVSTIMCIIAIACVLTVYVTTSQELVLKECLWLDVVVYGGWVFELSLVELMWYVIWKGFEPWIFLIFLPVILVPLLVGITIHRSLKKGTYSAKQNVKSSVGAVSFSSGILWMNIAAILFKNLDQNASFIVVLVCISILKGCMSLGFVSLLKLYYIKKYKISV